jgi:hypothetical protein
MRRAPPSSSGGGARRPPARGIYKSGYLGLYLARVGCAARSRFSAACAPQEDRSSLRPALTQVLRRRAAYTVPALTPRAGHGHGAHGVTHEGLTLYPAASWHKNVATGMSGLMW